MRIAVAGGTGLVGRMAVEAARAAGHDVVVIARSAGVDLTTGEGLDSALRDVQAVIDATNVITTSRTKSVRFFEASTGHLSAAGRRAGVRHHVVLSIVGVERVNYGYYQGKRRQEELVRAGGTPWTVLRATQFFEFAGQLLDRVPGPVVPLPRMLSQPVAAIEVAGELVRLAVAEPRGAVIDMAGPERLEVTAMARAVVRARRMRRLVLPVRLPGATARAVATGALLPTGEAALGRQRFTEWLGGQVAGPSPDRTRA
ncbi:NAD(P)H-binding protein [Actinoplanes sp. NEAU-A12]|uniref:NAD(P)H-binding protein n=1 Tax=Actinoplanes sandaracinus TaxID=3045177 RepID=A0ABT6WI08_9ACTN|nr:NAD(P)H-binding protein [Actinoplanes sandaracinus]MDI6099366.1 NAD(P)H-binding protein [Actinoplanes sandaracinus]